jgi:hypothetical protein
LASEILVCPMVHMGKVSPWSEEDAPRGVDTAHSCGFRCNGRMAEEGKISTRAFGKRRTCCRVEGSSDGSSRTSGKRA